VTTLDEFLEIVDLHGKAPDPIWYRGHADLTWELRPTALRYKRIAMRERALRRKTPSQQIGRISAFESA